MAAVTNQPLPALTGLRFFLALWVVSFHQAYSGQLLDPAILRLPHVLYSILRTGYAAVGCFYLLSGFVLAYGYDLSHKWEASSTRRFWLARAARIYPAYAFALGVTFPFAVLHLRSLVQRPSNPSFLFQCLLSVCLLQAWSPSSVLVWNGPGWSVSNEAFFYVLFPLLGPFIWLVQRMRHRVCVLFCLWILQLTAVVALVGASHSNLGHISAVDSPTVTSWNAFIEYAPLLHIVEFVAGILSAHIYRDLVNGERGFLTASKGTWLYLPALTAEFVLLANGRLIPFVYMQNALLLPMHAALVIGLALGGSGLPRMLATPVCTFLGKASYSLYLLHIGIWVWVEMFLHHVLHLQIHGIGYFLAYVALCIVVSSATFLYLEEPARRWLLKYFAPYTADARNSSSGCSPHHLRSRWPPVLKEDER